MEKIKREFSAGGVVYREEPEGVLWLVIKPKNSDQWRLPKGWIEPGERSMEAALREVKEEGGVKAEAIGKVDSVKYFFVQDKQKIFKTVIFYLMKYIQEAAGGIEWETEEIAWLPYTEAKDRLAFTNEKVLLQKAKEQLGGVG